MNSPRPFDKYNFILSVIGFIGSLGFYFGVLSKVYEQDPERQLIEQLRKENEFLKHELEKSIAMITRRNYYRVMQNVDIASLPTELQRSVLKLDELTENGNTWEYFTTPHPAFDYGEEVYPHRKYLLDIFNRLHDHLKRNHPQALKITGRPKTPSTGKYDHLPNDNRPQFRINSIRTGLYFLRKSNALHNTKQTRDGLLSLLNELQLSLQMGQIILNDFYIVIEKIQEEISEIITGINANDKEAKLIKFSPRTFAMIKAGLKKDEKLTSLHPRNIKPNKNDPEFLKAIKNYNQFQGRIVTHSLVRKLRQEFEKATFNRRYSDYEFDPYYPQFKKLLRELENFNVSVMEHKSMLPLSNMNMSWRYAYDEKEKNFLRELTPEGELGSLSGIKKPLVSNKRAELYADFIVEKLSTNVKMNRPQTEKVANELGITNKTLIKELTEYAIVKRGRQIALGTGSIEEKFKGMVNLYNHQTNISFRTSQSILLKQYSTPAPIGYLMGVYCGIDKDNIRVFEPSAGNGMLTIASKPSKVLVNEIDDLRRENLKRQKFINVLGIDAFRPFTGIDKSFEAVLTNPPFGRVGQYQKLFIEGYRIYDLDHGMAIYALHTMKDKGRSAIIVGGHLKYDDRGRIVAGKDRIFFNYLYAHYNVEDVIPVDGRKLYSRQGTTFNTTLILINGRKLEKAGVAPLYDPNRDAVIRTFDELYQRIMNLRDNVPSNKELQEKAKALLSKLKGNTLEGPYHPSSQARTLDTNVPDSMDFELHQALKQITQDVGGDMDNFVRHRLGYRTKQQLHDVLGAEQIDAVGMAIYNIEALNQGIIIGDQTGIGKGRIAASMIRYAHMQGVKPVFLTVGVNLFSDIYRDLEAIGSAGLVPFIVNARESKTDVKDQDGLMIYQAPTSIEQARVFESNDLTGYDFVMATYSQFSSADKKPAKPRFLKAVSEDTIIIMDESHIASGSSNTGQFMQSVIRGTKGAVFLSATFAKRPSNMPIYALKTAISETNMSRGELIGSIERGGVALQEILSAQLVSEGQMVRRERTYEGIEVNYISLDAKAEQHSAISDSITSIVRDIIRFQNLYVDARVTELDDMLSYEGAQIEKRKGTDQGGVDNTPYFSKVFNVINQMLFAIKAEDVADRAIMRLREGKKPVIAFSSTMGSFLDQLEDEDGIKATIGDSINADFAIVLDKGLEGVLRYTVTEPNGQKIHHRFSPEELGASAKGEYDRIKSDIRTISSGITISPIDVIIQKIEKEGYKVGEVTGRKLRLDLHGSKGTIENRKRFNTNDVFRRFNNNEIDALLINQSGSTGASAHAVPTSKVSADKVKQRVMIVLQPELDINIEIQKRGRINRTGQIYKPIYDYVNSAIPAEKRLMMMLQKKLKSLDANTSSNQKQSSKILSVPDFLNKYGDAIVVAHLTENPELNEQLGDPIKISVASKGTDDDSEDAVQKEDAASKVSGRVAVLSTRMQEEFYTEISERYENLVNYLKQVGDYDLEVEEMDLKAKTMNSRVFKMGKGGNTTFGEDSYLETIEANVLKKPFKAEELKSLLSQTLEGKTPEEYKQGLIQSLNSHSETVIKEMQDKIRSHYEHLRKNVENESKLKKVKRENPEFYNDALFERYADLATQEKAKLENDHKQITKRIDQMRDYFDYFTVGKQLKYPEEVLGGETVNFMAVFLGFKIEYKRKNPYAPSTVGLRFAVASSQKSIELPASYGMILNAIRGASINIQDQGIDHTLYEWGDAIYNGNKDRQIRHVITGNILQAFAQAKGKLISYTTSEGEIRKGILLPESIELEKLIGDGVTIPISKAINLFKSRVEGKQIDCSHGITFFRVADNMYKMIVSGSMREGGEVFLNLKVIALTFNDNFEKVGTNMTAHVEMSDLQEMLYVLEDDIGVSVKMTEQQINSMGLVSRPIRKRAKIVLPPVEEKTNDRVRLLMLQAKALEIELKLLARKNKAS